MIFQCKASELRKVVKQIKNWEAQLDTVPKNLKRIGSVTKEYLPKEVHLYLRKNETLEIVTYYRGVDDIKITIKGVILDDCFGVGDFNFFLADFYSLCKDLPEEGEVQINANHYQIVLYEVKE